MYNVQLKLVIYFQFALTISNLYLFIINSSKQQLVLVNVVIEKSVKKSGNTNLIRSYFFVVDKKLLVVCYV